MNRELQFRKMRNVLTFTMKVRNMRGEGRKEKEDG